MKPSAIIKILPVLGVSLLLGVVLDAQVFSRWKRGPADADAVAHVDSPRLVIPAPTFDFGKVERGRTVSHEFVLRNEGSATINIERVSASCGCATPEIKSKIIEPGGETKVKVTLNLRQRNGPQSQTILIQSNDPKQPNSTLSLTGNATWHVRVTPELVNYGRVNATDTTSEIVDVLLAEDLVLNVRSVKTNSDLVAAELTTIEPGKHYQVAVSLNPPVPKGSLSGWIELVTDHPKQFQRIRIPLLAVVMADGTVSITKMHTKVSDLTAVIKEDRNPWDIQIASLVKIGQHFDFSGPTNEGIEIDDSQFKGKPVVVVFWASWCAACRGHISQLIAIHEKYHARGLEVVGVSLDKSKEDLQRYIGDHKIPWENIYFDEDSLAESDNPLADKYNVRRIPWHVLLDREGKVVSENAQGPALDAAIAALFDGKPPAVGSSRVPVLNVAEQSASKR